MNINNRACPDIRIATLGDIAAMHAIRLSVLENRLSDATRVTVDHYREMLQSRGRGWVCEIEGGRVAGFGIADAQSRSIWALFVDPAHEGRGIGRRLHDATVHWLFEVASSPIWLTTEPGTRAERFYICAGWQRDSTAERGEVRFVRSR